MHHNGRPDIFKVGRKYSVEELKELLPDKSRPILVCVDENDSVMGYCFCIFQQHVNNSVLTDIKTLYIDDLCVDEKLRGRHIGKELYEAAVKLATEIGCYNLTLNVATSFLAVYLTFRRSPYFAAFLINDIYGYVSWQKMKRRQSRTG